MKPWYQTVNEMESRGESYVLITLMGARGSTPRNSGTKMLVTEAACFGTIGGGHLEFRATRTARELLREQLEQQKIEHFPLGAKLGQCCGGSTTVLFECFVNTAPHLVLFGAGHVGRALAGILSQLPCQFSWVDSRDSEFPVSVPDNVNKVVSDDPVEEISRMPSGAYYVIMTHNHPLDFALTEAALLRGDARYIGLIGSNTKWQRFKMRFEHRAYEPGFYSPVRCPVGKSDVPGKLPMEVAVSVAAEIIADYQLAFGNRATQQGVNWRDVAAPMPKAINSHATGTDDEVLER